MATKTIKKTDDKAATPVVKSTKILGPRVTEKAAYATEKNVYVFNVTLDANKIEIKKAIKDAYKVMPIAVNIVISKPRAKMFRGKPGVKKGFKKAYVTLKKGDTIDLN
ncbi:MAG: ribosomal protein [Patescibacteria group bacterium]|nr:ribosomal protein [Patescibacteria group bacterium]